MIQDRYSKKSRQALTEALTCSVFQNENLFGILLKGVRRFTLSQKEPVILQFFRDWLQYMITFTTTENDLSQQLWDALARCHDDDISDDTKRVISDILQGSESAAANHQR